MKTLLGIVAAMGVAGIAYAGDHAGKAADSGKTAAMGSFSISTATWTPFGDPAKGPWTAVISGDPKMGAFTTYLKVKAGTDSGWHTHNSDYTGVVLEGNITHMDQGAKEMNLTAGNAWNSKGGTNHLNKCLGKKDCVIFISSAGAMSYNPMTADGKPVPMPAAKTN